tara:strand:- start:183 stop:605 length:423 start_codon:yes stop_codon:yes gene_type:complete
MTTIIESIEFDFCTISLRSDGIIEQRFAKEDPYEITVEVLEGFIDAIKSLYKGKQRCILVIPGLYGSITAEARKMSIQDENSNTIAIGLIIESLSQRLLSKFYFKINKVPYPVQFFKSEIESTLWLHEQNKIHLLKNQAG